MSANDLEQFDQWTLSIGNGELKEIPLTDEMISTIITKNSKDNPNSELGAMSRFHCDSKDSSHLSKFSMIEQSWVDQIHFCVK